LLRLINIERFVVEQKLGRFFLMIGQIGCRSFYNL
jgi:hypothetical protein